MKWIKQCLTVLGKKRKLKFCRLYCGLIVPIKHGLLEQQLEDQGATQI